MRLNYIEDSGGGSQLPGAQVVVEDLVFQCREESVVESANISDWLEFRI